MKYLFLCILVLLAGCSLFKPKPKVILPDPAILSAEIDDPMAPKPHSINEEKPPLKVMVSDGTSFESAILITGARARLEKLTAQHEVITNELGTEGTDWEIINNNTEQREKKHYDIIDVRLKKDDSQRSFYFDTTDFYENI